MLKAIIQTNISNQEENLEKIQKSEQTLRESERGYRLLVENSTDVIYKKNSSYFLRDIKVLMYLKFLIILKKIFNIKN